MAKKQKELGLKGRGVERVRIPEIEKLAEAYVTERDKRMKLTPKEVAAKTKLIDAMHGHRAKLLQPDGSYIYRLDDEDIKLIPGKEKLKFVPRDEEEE